MIRSYDELFSPHFNSTDCGRIQRVKTKEARRKLERT